MRRTTRRPASCSPPPRGSTRGRRGSSRPRTASSRTLRRLDEDPPIKATDLRGPIGLSLGQTIAIARWTIIALRLALLADVGSRARQEHDRMGVVADLAANAVGAVRATDPDRLLAWLSRKRPSWTAALTPKRYALVWKGLHRDPS